MNCSSGGEHPVGTHWKSEGIAEGVVDGVEGLLQCEGEISFIIFPLFRVLFIVIQVLDHSYSKCFS